MMTLSDGEISLAIEVAIGLFCYTESLSRLQNIGWHGFCASDEY